MCIRDRFMADCPADIILIDALENAVKFGNALFRLGNFTLGRGPFFFSDRPEQSLPAVLDVYKRQAQRSER